MSGNLEKCSHCLGKGKTYRVEGGYSQLNLNPVDIIDEIDCPFCCGNAKEKIEDPLFKDSVGEEYIELPKKRGRKVKVIGD